MPRKMNIDVGGSTQQLVYPLTRYHSRCAHKVHEGLPQSDLLCGHQFIARLSVQHKVHDHRDNGHDYDQNPEEESLVRLRTVHGEVMGRLGSSGLDGILARLVYVRNRFDRLPHLEEDYGAYEGVLDGAGEQEWRKLLHQSTHNRGAGAAAEGSRRGRRSNGHIRNHRTHIGYQGVIKGMMMMMLMQRLIDSGPVRSTHGAIMDDQVVGGIHFVLADVENFVLGLLHQDVQPLTQVGGHHVHESEAGGHLVPGHVHVGGVQENELHLGDAQDHPADGCNGHEDIPASGMAIQLEELAKLQARIHHSSNGEGDGSHSQVKAAKMGYLVLQMHIAVLFVCKCRTIAFVLTKL